MGFEICLFVSQLEVEIAEDSHLLLRALEQLPAVAKVTSMRISVF